MEKCTIVKSQIIHKIHTYIKPYIKFHEMPELI